MNSIAPLLPTLFTVKVPEAVNLWYLNPPDVNVVPPVASMGVKVG
jgi:hypothetical protein